MGKEWVVDYFKSMIEDNPEKGIPLKLNNFPDTFYKYRGLNDYTLESLEEDRLWVADIESLNDPYECFLLSDDNEVLINFFKSENFQKTFYDLHNYKFTEEDIDQIIEADDIVVAYQSFCKRNNINIALDSIPKLSELDKWNEYKETAKKTTYICSFSEVNNSVVMWAHYADCHKGICIEYDLINCNDFRLLMHPVYYCNDFNRIRSLDEMTALTAVMNSTIKSKEWGYEKEWRFTNFKRNNLPEDYNYNIVHVPTPKAVYLGARFDTNSTYKKNQLLRIAREKKIPVFQMEMSEEKFVFKVGKHVQ
ncbi:MAG TPA: DUF2971 domain-containing protein [Flavipsychrobacter sp.]|nr:DUF2971 domain-containing protein [Flavipsychrobacter sp.]